MCRREADRGLERQTTDNEPYTNYDKLRTTTILLQTTTNYKQHTYTNLRPNYKLRQTTNNKLRQTTNHRNSHNTNNNTYTNTTNNYHPPGASEAPARTPRCLLLPLFVLLMPRAAVERRGFRVRLQRRLWR